MKIANGWDAARVKRLRRAYHGPLRLLAERLGCTQQTIGAWLAGRHAPTGVGVVVALEALEREIAQRDKEGIGNVGN
jgi:transcriptional regulator with XRE-family HTH domain